MKRKILSLFAVFMMLGTVGCGTDENNSGSNRSEVSQSDAAASLGNDSLSIKQSAICKATVIEIDNETMFVTPEEGSSELLSSDKFSVGIKNMEISPKPQVGDTVEITYSGDILEIYPASFDKISDIKVVTNWEDNSSCYIEVCQNYIKDNYTEKEIDTITNWESPKIEQVNLPEQYAVIDSYNTVENSSDFYAVTFFTTEDALLGPIIFYLNKQGTILGQAFRE